MSKFSIRDIVRAWRDPEHREALAESDRAQLPESPAGAFCAEIDAAELSSVSGGARPWTLPFMGCGLVPTLTAECQHICNMNTVFCAVLRNEAGGAIAIAADELAVLEAVGAIGDGNEITKEEAKAVQAAVAALHKDSALSPEQIAYLGEFVEGFKPAAPDSVPEGWQAAVEAVEEIAAKGAVDDARLEALDAVAAALAHPAPPNPICP
ncbi:MAG: mersacidin/lichenicidin family type 2 lantibiotic [Minicystis sp.]